MFKSVLTQLTVHDVTYKHTQTQPFVVKDASEKRKRHKEHRHVFVVHNAMQIDKSFRTSMM